MHLPHEATTPLAAPAVTVNGQPHPVGDGPVSLAELLDRLGHGAASLATAVNGEFVPRAQRAGRLLRPGDQVTCFQPIVGG